MCLFGSGIRLYGSRTKLIEVAKAQTGQEGSSGRHRPTRETVCMLCGLVLKCAHDALRQAGMPCRKQAPALPVTYRSKQWPHFAGQGSLPFWGGDRAASGERCGGGGYREGSHSTMPARPAAAGGAPRLGAGATKSRVARRAVSSALVATQVSVDRVGLQ